MKSKSLRWLLVAIALGALVLATMVCLALRPRRGETFLHWMEEPTAGDFVLESPAFASGQPIPALYTCQGENISPPLTWSEPPQGARSFVLILDDPDAPLGTWTHWVVYNIAAEARSLSAGFQPDEDSPVRLASNSWGRQDYGGPCPPSGTHRYIFHLCALDTALAQPVSDKAGLLEAIEGHILACADLTGVYRKE